ncbi:ubiquinone/menaquinone biosynthesis C-methylase UbiE [Nocardia transvalensis]|uniref:Ubiquinone/menaquinone biosynthesis C-methylase UbiE n=1 Tax=Nocardia transvalensis TaxID=37333 RepID=A0A7W9PMD0_9NOCA|nr:class I SAM-dependent methyltransferase [Nocardia transvalensis]MBB5918610.1 ubiquinone/menaquinone biosynthesis C-methylase UbiE [Nocardia transvalensis]
MTEHHPHSVTTAMGNHHDYLPAAGRDSLLPAYDLLSRALGVPRLHERLVDQADLRDDHRILEVGCGTGNLTLRIKRARPAAEVIGADPDPRALARAERKARDEKGIRFDHAYGQELPYEDGEFDRVLSSLMLHHLDTGVRTAMAAEILRVLRPGGRLHLADIGGPMTPADGLAARLTLRTGHLTGNLGDGIPRLLRGAGFDCTEVATERHRRMGRVSYYRATRPD